MQCQIPLFSAPVRQVHPVGSIEAIVPKWQPGCRRNETWWDRQHPSEEVMLPIDLALQDFCLVGPRWRIECGAITSLSPPHEEDEPPPFKIRRHRATRARASAPLSESRGLCLSRT